MKSNKNQQASKTMLSSLFTLERVITRLIASWLAFVTFSLLTVKGSFTELSFLQSSLSPVAMAAIVVMLFALFTMLAYLLPTFETDSWGMLAFALLASFHWATKYDGKNAVSFAFGLTLALSFFVFYFLTKNEELLPKWRPGKKTTLVTMIVCGAISCTVIAIVTCYRYLTYSAPNYDFGLFCQMFHYMKETGLPLSTAERDGLLSHFAVHISPVYYLLLPFYFIFPSPLTLQIGQAVAIASGIIPVWFLCRKFNLSGKLTMLVTAIYAFYPALSTGCFYDIHENCFLPVLLLWLFYFYEKKLMIPTYVFAVLVLTVKEDAAIYLLFFALFVFFSKKDRFHGLLIGLLSIFWFFMTNWLLTKFGEGVMANRYGNLILNKEDGLFGAVKTILMNPGFAVSQLFTSSSGGWEKLIYLLEMLLPLSLIPFATKKPSRWLLAAPLLINLFTTYQYQYDIGFQYHFGISAFLVYALILNLPELDPKISSKLLPLGAVACLVFYLVIVTPSVGNYVSRYQKNQDTYRKIGALLDTIPDDASLNISTLYLAHESNRDKLYEISYHKDKTDVDYVVYDVGYKDYSASIQTYKDAGYEVWAELEGEVLILKSPSAQ